ncbi:hypothetical protein NEOLEDRAFT_1145757 [Neolentinus lepideus HHB14362 ss-1]|uniref:HTH APSES-type domain-containing protein n=1 Tax=Neolentinus lepideus HHB14362 ss-1 TaxID=1314782 RepID=A0A165UQJ4_9AGAM|nr:hypothetical protein NEOLEDRAFT_1145757 [Neolentinus lepideus HHB14362 ss-1]
MAAMPDPSSSRRDSLDNHPSSANHKYGTRIRSNSIIRPSARLRQSPDPPPPPRRIKPAPSAGSKSKPMLHESPKPDMPLFPPPHVMLHPDDLNSKVFLAIGRCFFSVDNRAMTIKDLAEMTLQFGLTCQNVSAAGQALTTYIRAHMHRCEVQQDQPLLLRQPLSGTPSDDDLVEALHSRAGGAHCPGSSNNRITNFRKGTFVWYLSKAAGAPCPFERAGIRICEYNENGRVGQHLRNAREKKRDKAKRATRCGEKRKRLLRSCADKGASESASSSDEEERRPPKIKLTLRLRPTLAPSPASSSVPSSTPMSTPATTPAPAETHSSESSPNVIDLSRTSDVEEEDDEMSVDSSEGEDEEVSEEDEEEQWTMQSCDGAGNSSNLPFVPAFHSSSYPYLPEYAEYRRSPSIPYSIASPPPDSEEEDDFHLSMTGSRWDDDDELDWDDDEEDADTDARSPGPRSPVAHSGFAGLADVIVKQEPKDVASMLDHWEHLDNADRIVKIIAQAAAADAGRSTDYDIPPMKLDQLNLWDWDSRASPLWDPNSPCLEDAVHVKQEEEEYFGRNAVSPVTSAVEHDDLDCTSPLTPLSALSPGGFDQYAELRRSTDMSWADAEVLGPDSVDPEEFDEEEWPDAKEAGDATVKASVSPLPDENNSSIVDTHSSEASRQAVSYTPEIEDNSRMEVEESGDESSRSPSLSASVRTINSPEPLKSPDVKPSPLQADMHTRLETQCPEVVVVRTCEPCNPPVWATEVEGISVYQMTLGTSPLLRRIDTDYVNLSPIAKHIGAPLPSTKVIPNAMVISRGSPIILGTWVPLASAQDFIREHPVPDDPLDIFLSDVLYERFPKALHDFHMSHPSRRLLNHFGPHFRSTLELRLQTSLSKDSAWDSSPWDVDATHEWMEEHLMAVHTPYLMLPPAGPLLQEDTTLVETPLSPTEQEMFHTLCAIPDWDNVPPAEDDVEKEPTQEPEESQGSVEEQEASPPPQERPLRRSKRVANAIAARSRTRSSKRASRGSLS